MKNEHSSNDYFLFGFLMGEIFCYLLLLINLLIT